MHCPSCEVGIIWANKFLNSSTENDYILIKIYGKYSGKYHLQKRLFQQYISDQYHLNEPAFLVLIVHSSFENYQINKKNC